MDPTDVKLSHEIAELRKALDNAERKLAKHREQRRRACNGRFNWLAA